MTDTENIMQKIWTALEWIPVTEHDEKPWKPVRAAVERVVQESNDRLRGQQRERAERAEVLSKDWEDACNRYTARAERAEAERDELNDTVRYVSKALDDMQQRAEKAEAERDALKELLRRSREWIGGAQHDPFCDLQEGGDENGCDCGKLEISARIDAALKEGK